MEVTKEEMLALAIRCIGNQEMNCCNDVDCAGCPYNISQYTDDPRIALSIMGRAKYIWPKTREADTYYTGKILIYVIIAFLFFFIGAWLFGEETEIKKLDYKQYDYARVCNKTPSVMSVLNKVQNNLRDVNYDGKINCIDYAVIFYEWMPGSFILYLDNKSINHLFNGHLNDKKINFELFYWFRYLDWVEPQATTEKYNADAVWKKNKDWNRIMVVHTDEYYKYAIRKQWEWVNKAESKWRWIK